jgi:hypothetical protein
MMGLGLPLRTGAGNLLFVQSIETGCGFYPASCTVSTGDTLPCLKRPEREADHFSPFNVKVSKYAFTYVFMAGV